MRPIPNGKMMAAALVLLAGAAGATAPPSGPLKRCPVDAVVSGAGCMDKFEASVWRVPNATTSNRSLVSRIQQGKATAADLAASGATQLGVGHNDDYAPCADSGQNCVDDIFAVSLPGVKPSANITWFQAQAACESSGKRLPSNAEWQAAVAGTPDPGSDDGTTDCNTASAFNVHRRRVAQRLQVDTRGVRHGGQSLRVGGGLGAAGDGMRHVESWRQPDG